MLLKKPQTRLFLVTDALALDNANDFLYTGDFCEGSITEMERGTQQGKKGKDSMPNDRMMTVKVTAKDTERAKRVLKVCPTWSNILGEQVEINLLTATKKGEYVHFRGVVLTGPRTGTELTISTAVLDLTQIQYEQIESLIGGEATTTA